MGIESKKKYRLNIKMYLSIFFFLFSITSCTRNNDYTSPLIGTLVYIKAGAFQRDEKTKNISRVRGFWMGRYEITRKQFYDVMGYDPSNSEYSMRLDDPVQNINWYQAITFCNKLSLKERLKMVYKVKGIDFINIPFSEIPTERDKAWDEAVFDRSANGYRLPTEMEWKWAAIGGYQSMDNNNGINTSGFMKAFAGDNGNNKIDDYVWYNKNSGNTSHPVGLKLPNELGLYDMSGNVEEWCWDIFGDVPEGKLSDYSGSSDGSSRVFMGSDYEYSDIYCELWRRYGTLPFKRFKVFGLRVAR
jgi:formylglycine-generating enzyme required for sulfatase activity